MQVAQTDIFQRPGFGEVPYENMIHSRYSDLPLEERELMIQEHYDQINDANEFIGDIDLVIKIFIQKGYSESGAIQLAIAFYNDPSIKKRVQDRRNRRRKKKK